MIDVYYRRRDSSCSSSLANKVPQSEPDNLTQQAETEIETKASSMEEEDSSGLKEEVVLSGVSKRACYGLSSSRSSGSADSSSLTVASVPYLSGFIDSWHPFARYFDTPPKTILEGNENQCGFSLRPSIQVGTLSEEDSQQLMTLFDQVVREDGLDVQDYECAECTRAIGTIFGPAKICAYTRRYYCEECHLDETALIPTKVMYNWDFRQFKVCHKAKLFLSSVNLEPIIDVKSFNAELFEFAPSLTEIFDLRRQLRYMNAYLSTCANGKSQAKATFHKVTFF